MKHIYPTYYKNFKCIANECPDSCCKDWDVVVDEESESFYNSVNTEFGEKIRSLTVTDNDGDRIFVSQNGKCPFWNKEMLCDIYINLGEEHLCETCKNFPRITQDYTEFVEHTISLACPEGARLILETEYDYNEFDNFKYDGDNDDLSFLIEARYITAQIFKNRIKSFAQRLIEALEYNKKVQNRLEKYSEAEGENNLQYIFELHQKLEIMGDEWREILESVGNNKPDENHDIEFERLALYYIYRYYLNAIDSFDVLSTIKRIACAYLVLSRCNLVDSCTRLMQLYSKEVEHSYENSEMLESEFVFAPQLSVSSIINSIKIGLPE